MVEQKAQEPNKDGAEAEAQDSPIPADGTDGTIHRQPPKAEEDNDTRRLEEQMSRSERGMTWSTIVTAVFTIVLAALAGIQAYSFIESERAVLVVDSIRFTNGDPTATSGYDITFTLKNVGRHVANVTKFNIRPTFFIKRKTLPNPPSYAGGDVTKVVPPIVPSGTMSLQIQGVLINPPDIPITEPQRLAGVLDGTIPFRVFGFVEYDKGFPSWKPSIIGFCDEYQPPVWRGKIRNMFETCNDPQYTYAR